MRRYLYRIDQAPPRMPADLPPSDSSTDHEGLRPESAAAGEALRELRARAERRRLVTQSPPPESPAEMQRLVQELQVHQIELEMQYEELLLAQAEAEASRAQYLDLYEFAPVSYCTLDAAGTLLQLNLRTAQLLGLVRQQLQGRRLALFVEPAQRSGFLDFLTRVLAADPTDPARHVSTLALVRPDGQPLELRLEATRAQGATGQPLARLALIDVTEQQRATRALAESAQRLRQALDAATMGVVSWDFATDQWQADARAQAIWGLPYTTAPRPADTLAAYLHPADRPRFRQLAERPAPPTTEFDLELRLTQAGAPDRHVSLTGHTLAPGPGHPQGCLLGLVRDRTQRRRTEQELSYKTQLLEHILAHLPVLLGRLDPSGHYLELVGAGLRRLHLADNELVGQSIFECFPSLAEPSHRLLAGEPVDFVGSASIEGEPVYYQSYGFFDTARNEAVMFALDVTEREQQRAKLEQQQQFTQSLLDHSIDALIALDAGQRITAWNRQSELYTGISAAAALGRPLDQVLPVVADDPAFRPLLARALAGESSQLLNWGGRYFVGQLDLNLRPFSSPGQPSGVLLMARDVTQREQLLAETTRLQLRQQQLVLSAILTTQEEERRRIAEALHNGVGQLLYATRLHLTQLPDSEPLRAGQQLLQEAIRATRSISFELTPRILEDFGLPTALRELADRVPVSLLRLDLRLEGLEEPTRPLPAPVQMAAYRIVQELLSNVMKHAQARRVALLVAGQPARLRIRITDDGVGFEPAPVPASGGIGLAGIRNRVELLGGTLLITSAPTKGTTIEIELPLQGE